MSADREAARISLVTDLQALAPSLGGIPLDYPNLNKLDPALQSGLFIKTCIVYDDSWQASMSDTQHTRVIGQLQLEFWYNANTGMRTVNEAMKKLYPGLQMKDRPGGARTMAVKFGPTVTKLGWNVDLLSIPFWYDEHNPL